MCSRPLFLAPLALIAWLSVTAVSPALARVNDEGSFFSPDAVKTADGKIKEIDRDYRKDLLIATVVKVPDQLQDKYKEMGKKDFFVDWSRKRAQDAQVKGIYILICKDPAHLQIEIDRATRAKAFTFEDRDRLLKKIVPLLREKKNDAALSETVDFIATTFRANLGKRDVTASGSHAGQHRVPNQVPHGAMGAEKTMPQQEVSPWVWVVVVVVVLLGLWLVIRVVGALAGSGGGGGIGGGGGGFFTSLLGGMFGAAAGMWIYDSFFRGGSQAFGGSQDFGESGAGDFGGDSGGGADFGDDGGGGDFGGGDFGD